MFQDMLPKGDAGILPAFLRIANHVLEAKNWQNPAHDAVLLWATRTSGCRCESVEIAGQKFKCRRLFINLFEV